MRPRVGAGVRALLALVLLLAVAAPVAEARLDRDFAKPRGWRMFTVGAYDSGAEQVIRTRGGKLLVAGYAVEPKFSDPVFGFARFHPSGKLDRRFGRRGRALVDIPEYPGAIVGLHERPDRKLLFAYSSTEGLVTDYRVVRLHASGKLDRSYGDGGVAKVQAPAGNASLAGMAVLPGGAVALAGTVGLTDAERRVVVMRVAADGRSSQLTASLDLGGARAAALVRTRLGHLVLAANRTKSSGRPHSAVLTGLGPNPYRREFPGTQIVDLDRDRRTGVAALLVKGYRWAVRRHAEDLRPRRAPKTMSARGKPSAMAVGPGNRTWVGLIGGSMRLVRPDGRLDGRGSSFDLKTSRILDTTALVALPRNRVVAVGRTFDLGGGIREDYPGPEKMWIGRFRRR